MPPAPATIPYRAARFGGALSATVEERADGCSVLRSTEALQAYPERLSDRLAHWARATPGHRFAARRGADGPWQHISYAAMLERAQRIGQALVERGLSAERPLVILSENDLEHLTLAMAAMWVGVPHAPISPAYSLVSGDFAKLRHILSALTPGMVYASGPAYARALTTVVGADAEIVLGRGGLDGRATTSWDSLLATPPGPQAAAAHAATGPDTIVKFLFTSGSTKDPKGVINTHRMLCANQQMLRQVFAFFADEPPVLVDWLPWNHTFGGNHNVGIALYNGGTLYIDDGKPTPEGIAETLRNLREIAPTVYFNVPKGFEEIVGAMEDDAALRESLFRRVKAFMYAGAALAQPVWDRLDRHAERTVGERIRMITGLGMTETAPSCTFAVGSDVRAGCIGLPVPGVEVKLVPLADKTEIRFRGPNVMPGYWRAPQQTAEAFDEEGYYRTGDAVRYVDRARPGDGLMFDGRLAEDFKLSTGTFVHVGALRSKIAMLGAPLVADAVIAGLNHDDISVLLVPRLDDCRKLAGLAADVGAAEVLAHPRVRDFFQRLVDRLWAEGTGSANRVARAHVLHEAPSLETGELTDKGSINQRAVLTHRAALVASIYAGTDPLCLLPARA
ncbi:MAG: feruloyl-CoA synthase [Burkholderiales bacterium]|nr:feruloyl-CoA synthase [Burkholderiales bacterium]MDE1928926.1 feruloyl-CoA synthase [Burkholderiales bacterium]MDE2158605.1 feruloyl-CoA synthase [Burkholderiales bacterium]MDE2504738.1 feruloyl-CoA synthase [Burkholderiales bacterium]